MPAATAASPSSGDPVADVPLASSTSPKEERTGGSGAMAENPPTASPELQQLSLLAEDMEIQNAQLGMVYSEYVYNIGQLDQFIGPIVLPLRLLESCNAQAQRELALDIRYLEEKLVLLEKRGCLPLVEGRDLLPARRKMCEVLKLRAEEERVFAALTEDVTPEELIHLQNYVNPPPPVLALVRLVARLAGCQFCPFCPSLPGDEEAMGLHDAVSHSGPDAATGCDARQPSPSDGGADASEAAADAAAWRETPWESLKYIFAKSYYYSFFVPRITRRAEQLLQAAQQQHQSLPLLSLAPPPQSVSGSMATVDGGDAAKVACEQSVTMARAGWELFNEVRYFCAQPECSVPSMCARSVPGGALCRLLHWLCDLYVLLDVTTPVTVAAHGPTHETVDSLHLSPDPLNDPALPPSFVQHALGMHLAQGATTSPSALAPSRPLQVHPPDPVAERYPATCAHFPQVSGDVRRLSVATDGVGGESGSRPMALAGAALATVAVGAERWDFPLPWTSHSGRCSALRRLDDVRAALLAQHARLRDLRTEALGIQSQMQAAQQQFREKIALLRERYDLSLLGMEDEFIGASDAFNALLAAVGLRPHVDTAAKV